MQVDKNVMIECIDVNKEYRRAGAIIRALVDINISIKSGDLLLSKVIQVAARVPC